MEQQQNKDTLFVRELQRVGAATEQRYIYTICQGVTESWSSNRTKIHIHYLSESYRQLEQQQNKYTYTLFVRELQRVGAATEQVYIYTICQRVTESWSSNKTNIHIHYLSGSYRELEQQQNKDTYTLFVRELQRVGAATEQIYIYTICQGATESWNSNRRNIHIHYLSESYRELEQQQNKDTLFVRELQRVGAATEQIYIYTICQRVTESWSSNRTNIHIHYLSGSYRELEQQQNKYTYTLFVRELQRVGAATEQRYIYTICQGVTESWSSNRTKIHIHYLSGSYRELEQQQNKDTLFVRELQRVGAATEQRYIYTICQRVTESWNSNRTNIHIHYLSESYRELEQQQNKYTYTLFVRELQRIGAATEQRYIYTICQVVTESWSSNRTKIHIHYLSGSYRELEQQQNKDTLFVRELQRVGAATEQRYTICQGVTESWSSNRTKIHIHYLSGSYRELEQQQNKYTYTLFVRELQRVGAATEQRYTIGQGVTESWSSNRTNIHVHYLSESYRELEQQQNKDTYTLFVRELQRVGAATEQRYIYTICQ